MNVTKSGSNVTIYIAAKDVSAMDIKHILHLYSLATDEEKTKEWYAEAQQFASNLADKTGVSIETVANVIAAISPRQRWETNMKMAERAVTSWVAFKNGTLDKLPPCHHFSQMSNQAYKILAGESVQLGPKTACFAKNILGDTQTVTVDSLAVSIPLGLYECAGTYKFKDKIYTHVANLYTEAARIVNVSPAILQAITWEVCRRLKQRNGGNLLQAYAIVGESPIAILNYMQNVAYSKPQTERMLIVG